MAGKSQKRNNAKTAATNLRRKSGPPATGAPDERSEVFAVEATRVSDKRSEALVVEATGAPEEQSEVLAVEATSPRRRGGKSTGRKSSQPALEILPAEPGQGASRLRNSVNSLLASEADRLACMLFSKAIAGNIPSARLLVELSGANKPPAEEDEDSDWPSLAGLLASQPPYIDPDNPNILQLPSGEIFVRQSPEDAAALDAGKLPFANPKLLSPPKPDD